MRRGRVSVCLSSAALAVAVLGSTPAGHAAGRALRSIPPFAKTAAYAKLAGNAKLLSGHKASAGGGAGTIPVLDGQGKLPASLGAVGPAGAAGTQGPAGASGAPGTARAYALWDDLRGKLVHAHNVSSVTAGSYGNGDWCVTLDQSIDASSVVPQAAVEFNEGATGFAEWSNETGGCSTHPNSIQIWTFALSGSAQPKSFTVIVP